MNKIFRFFVIASLVGILLVFAGVQPLPTLLAVSAAPIANTGALSGAVKAPKPFQAAQVYVRNLQKNILYMVYTAGGRYRAVNLFPGNYEVSVRKSGLASDIKKVAIQAGENATADFSLHESATEAAVASYGMPVQENLQLVSYEELYPPGPGRGLVEKTCLVCHGQNFLPSREWSPALANAALDLMMNTGGNVAEARIPPSVFSPQDRETVLAYLTKQFGPGSPKRALKVDAEFPVDEQALSRAMYIEYYLPLDPKLDADNKQRRGQDPHFDNDGNVWYTDRIVPNRVGRLDPRTGEIKDYVTPDPKGGLHGLTVDKQGHIWANETTGMHLLRLDPKTGEFNRYALDANKTLAPQLTGQMGAGRLEGHTPVMDSKQNVWFTVIDGSRLGKWDRKTEKITLYAPPTPNSSPYGVVVDKDDTIWLAEFRAGKIAHYNPATEKWTEYLPLTQPCVIRRLSLDSKGTVWYGVFSSGKLGKLDPKTGKMVEYEMPMPYSQPYDVWPDREDNIWIGDGGQGGTMIKFDPRTAKFTYYPSPQTTDMPKFEITREGAIWYNPRSSSRAAVGVLYPDVNKITTLAAFY